VIFTFDSGLLLVLAASQHSSQQCGNMLSPPASDKLKTLADSWNMSFEGSFGRGVWHQTNQPARGTLLNSQTFRRRTRFTKTLPADSEPPGKKMQFFNLHGRQNPATDPQSPAVALTVGDPCAAGDFSREGG